MQASVELKSEIDSRNVLVCGNVSVCEHHALGLAGRAGGVDQRGQILGLDRLHQRIEYRVALRATRIGACQYLAERNCTLRRRSGGVHDENPLQRRVASDRIELVKLLSGRNDGDAAACVLHQHGDLLSGQCG